MLMLKEFSVAELHDRDSVIVKNCRHVLRGEFIRGVRYQ